MTRRVRKVDPAYLRRVAVWYLERWEAPAEGLRRVLLKRVRRSELAHGTDREEASAWVEEVVREAQQAGLVDDARYAATMRDRWRSSGCSTAQIRARLRQKGLNKPVIEHALATEAAFTDTDLSPDHLAALRYARRRRFGPWRAQPATPERLQKELAAMGRRGFGYDLARTVVDDETPADAWEDLLMGLP